jgi:hypothetical protein
MAIKVVCGQVIKSGEDHYQYGKHHPSYHNVLDQKFGKLLVVEQEPGKGVVCQCDCGRIHTEKFTVSLRNGRRKSCGICTNNSSPNWRPEEDKVILNNAGQLSTEDIAKLVSELGYREATAIAVKNRVKNLKVKGVDISLRRKGELYPHSKGSDHEIELCRQLYDLGLYPKEIAEKMEFTRSHVSAIVYYHSRTESA